MRVLVWLFVLRCRLLRLRCHPCWCLCSGCSYYFLTFRTLSACKILYIQLNMSYMTNSVNNNNNWIQIISPKTNFIEKFFWAELCVEWIFYSIFTGFTPSVLPLHGTVVFESVTVTAVVSEQHRGCSQRKAQQPLTLQSAQESTALCIRESETAAHKSTTGNSSSYQ